MHEKKGIFCRTESVAMTPKLRDHMPTTSLWGIAAKWPEHRVSFEANPMRYTMGFAKSHSLKCSLHKWA